MDEKEVIYINEINDISLTKDDKDKYIIKYKDSILDDDFLINIAIQLETLAKKDIVNFTQEQLKTHYLSIDSLHKIYERQLKIMTNKIEK